MVRSAPASLRLPSVSTRSRAVWTRRAERGARAGQVVVCRGRVVVLNWGGGAVSFRPVRAGRWGWSASTSAAILPALWVGEHTPGAPGLSAGEAVVDAAAPAVVRLGPRDPSLGPGAPLHELDERAGARHVRRAAPAFTLRGMTPPRRAQPGCRRGWRRRRFRSEGDVAADPEGACRPPGVQRLSRFLDTLRDDVVGVVADAGGELLDRPTKLQRLRKVRVGLRLELGLTHRHHEVGRRVVLASEQEELLGPGGGGLVGGDQR